MKKPVFNDLNQREYEDERDAIERRGYLSLVHQTVAGGDDKASAEIATLSRDMADLTDGASLTAVDLKLPLHLRAFVDAVIGATAGSPDFVEVTDRALAKRMGRSTKTVQSDRAQFRAWKDHGAVIQIRDNWRHPESGESHAHAYKCNLTRLAVDTTIEARLDPLYEKDRSMALRKAAHDVSRCAQGYRPPKQKRKRVVLDAELLRRNLLSAANALKKATQLRGMIINPDFELLFAYRQQIVDELAAFDAAFELGATSTQVPIKERVEIRQRETPDSSALETRVEAENEGGSGSTLPPGIGQQNQQDTSLPPVSVTVTDEEFYSAPGVSDEEIDTAFLAHEGQVRARRVFDELDARLKGGAT